MDFKLTRIAPTPSGYLHLGNLYSILITKVLAQKTGAKILLRIDDLDRDRYKEEYVQDIFDTLDFMGIEYDIGPRNLVEFEKEWSQIHRMNSYLDALETLRGTESIFACDCSRKKIQQLDSSGYYLGHCQSRGIPLGREDVAWRMDTFESDFIYLNTYLEGRKPFTLPEDSAFFVVRKKDRLPAYQLTSVMDDVNYGVDFIVRGNDLLGSSLDQQIVAKELSLASFSKVIFHHHAVLKGPKKKKISKSQGATSIQSLRKAGKTPKEIYSLIGELLDVTEPITDFESFSSLIKTRKGLN